jgi:exopolysaccharide biosynthesis predicted pyruvyltransferase EpsI
MILVGIAPVNNLGDFLQYYSASKMLNNFEEKALYIRVDEASQIPHELKELLQEGFSIYNYIYNYNILSDVLFSVIHSRKICVSQRFRYILFHFLSNIHRYHDNLRQVTREDLVIFGGHTSHVFNPIYTELYQAFKSQNTKLVALPMSIDLRGVGSIDQIIFKKYCKILGEFDYLFVRGAYTYALLNKVCKIGGKKIEIKPDVAFYIRKIFPLINKKRNEKIKIAIIPRRDIFEVDEFYRYIQYLSTLIYKLTQKMNNDVEIYLTSLALSADYSAIESLLNILKTKISLKNSPKILTMRFDTLHAAWNFYSNVDLLITTRMHDGIMGLSASKPAFFIFPKTYREKVLDVLTTLKLNTNYFFMSLKEMSLLPDRITFLLDNYEEISRDIDEKVEKAVSDLESLRTKIESLRGG